MSREPPHVVIAGAGIGGLTAALALARTGCRVSLLERADRLTEAGAGLQLSPNATRVLLHLGLLERLQPFAVAPEGLRIRRGRDGKLLAFLPLGRATAGRWGAPTLLAHRADFQRVLLDAVAGEPRITLALGAELCGFVEEPDGIRIEARGNAAMLAGDALIGADGLHSTVRSRLRRASADGPFPSGRTAWRSIVPAAALGAGFLKPETNLWLGRRAHLVHYPLRGGAVVNLVALVEDAAAPNRAAATEWNMPGEARVLGDRFASWADEARRLVAAATDWRIWPLLERPSLRRWSAGRVSLLGDAAHPMLPFLAQGAAQAIEDAAALAAAVAASPHDVPAALERYEGARAARAAAVQRWSRRQGRIYHLSGPMALARDLVMRRLGPERLAARFDWLYGGGIDAAAG